MKRLVLLSCIASLLFPSGLLPAARAALPRDTNVPGQNITTAVTWNLAGSPYIVQGLVNIASGGSLTIEPGVVVKFDANQWMRVEAGGVLTATGTSGQPISFTSSAGSPAPGDWQDLVVYGAATLQHCDFSHGAGGGHWSQLEINSSSVVVEDCAIHDGLRDGIRLWGDPGTTPTLRNLAISNNGMAAIRMTRLDISAVLDNLTLSGNGLDALTWETQTTGGGNVTINGAGLNGAPLQGGNLQLSAGTQLTLTAGTTLKLGTGAYLQVSSGTQLVAAGTAAQPVTITSAAASPGPGDWQGIFIQSGAAATLQHCDLAYGGGGAWSWNIEIDSPNVLLEDCAIHHGLHDGVRLDGLGGMAPTLRNVLIHDNAGAAMYSGDRVSPHLQNVTFAGNGANVWQMAGGGTAGDHLTFEGGGLNGAPIVLLGDPGINAGSVVTLTPGTTLAFEAQKQLSVSDGSSLIADGTPSQPIIFTTANASPAPGQWGRIVVGYTGANLLLDNCVVRYAGYGGNSAVQLQTTGSVQITHCVLEHNQNTAITVDAEIEAMQADHNVYRDNAYGIDYNPGLPVGVLATPIDARFSSWDDPSGPFNATSNPSGLGLGVDDYVLFAPWDEGVAGDGPDLVTTVSAAAGPWHPGDNLSVSYVVTNTGAQATSATAWEDALYFSADQDYDSGDILLGTQFHAGSLAPSASYTASLNVPVPNVAERPWFVLAVADHNYTSGDADRTTNTGASGPVLVQVPTLPMNTTTLGQAPWPRGALYKFTPSAGGNVLLSLDAPEGGWLLSVRALNAPTPNDYAYRTWSGAGATTLRLKNLPPVPHYVWVKPQNIGPNLFSLTAQTFTLPEPLALDSVSPDVVDLGYHGWTRAVSVTIRGAGFTPATTVSLLDPENEVQLDGVRFLDENTLRANVHANWDNPSGCVLPCGGTFDVQVHEGAQTVALPDGLTAGWQIQLGAPPANDRPPCELNVSFDAPQFVRSGREFPVTVNWENHCGDLTPQQVLLTSDNARFRFPADPAPRGQYLELFITNQGEGPLELIPQGATGSILVLAQPITGGTHVAVPLDLSYMQTMRCEPHWPEMNIVCGPTHHLPPLALFRPDHVSEADWATLTNPSQLGLNGFTQGYLDWLTAEAVRLARQGVRTADVNTLIASALGWRIDSGVLQRQYLGALGYGLPDPTNIHLETDGFGDYFLKLGSASRPFLAQPNGGWRGVPGDNAVLVAAGGIVTLTEPDGTRMIFLPDGRLGSVKDASGNTLTAGYTGGRLTSYTDSLGDTVSFAYNGQGRLASVTDPVGRVTTYTYNPAGDLLTAVNAPNGTIQFEYSTATDVYRRHAVTRIIFPDGNAAHFSYDAQGRLTQQSLNGAAEVLNLAYDAVTGETTITDALGQSVTQERGLFGPAAFTSPLGQTGEYTYDSAGRLTGREYAGNAVAIAYDVRGRPVAVTDSLGQTAQMGYTLDTGLLARFSDPNGNVTRFDYDSHANLVEIERADGTAENFDYDQVGQPVQVTDRRGQTLRLTYNATGLLTRKDYPDGHYILFDYDAHRNLTQTVEVSATARLTLTLTYDGSDRLTRITYPNGRYVNYQYDVAGRIAHLSDQSSFSLDYDYAPSGRLWRVRNSGNTLVEYTYDAAGRLTRAQNGNNTATTYQFDASSHVTRIALLGPGDALLREFVYTYDALGRRITQTTTEGTTSFGYDAVGQLTSASLPGGPTLTYTYDAAGNRTQTTTNAVPTAYSANALNQYTDVGGSPLTYDADGNTLTHDGATYTWDADGNLTAMNAPGEAWTFEYDALGNRVAATRNGVRTEYLVDPTGMGDVLAEYNGAGTLIARYVHGQGLVSRIAGGNAAYYGFDATGNTALLTDPTGAVINTYRYLPFGEVANATEGLANPFQFGGKWGMLRAAGLTLSRLRGYSPSLGRFISEEPSEVLSTNLYRYAGNSPMNFTDPDGLWPTSVEEWLSFSGHVVDAMEVPVDGTLWAMKRGNATEIAGLEKFGTASVADIRHSAPVLAFESEAKIAKLQAKSLARAKKLAVQGAKWRVAQGPLKVLGTGLDVLSTGVEAYQGVTTFANDVENYNKQPTDDNMATVLQNMYLSTAKTATGFIPFGDIAVDAAFWLGDNTLGRATYGVVHWAYSRGRKPEDVLNQEAYQRWLHHSTDQRTSGDPNEIAGPVGFGNPGWLAPQEMLYTIHFENVPTATAPAGVVLVTTTLDPDLDPASVRVWGYGFGDTSRAFAQPQATINEVVEAEALLGVDVHVTATAQGSQLTWLFTTLDPATGGQPAPWLPLGFLPPNDNQGAGEGWVIFSALPLAGKPTGTAATAQARVYFDDNPYIDTNVHLNTLDTVPPTATVSTMPTVTHSLTFTVNWSGSDADSGIAGYDVWVAINGDWGLWQSQTVATSAVFTGTPDSLYEFVVLAVDNAGNRPPVPPAVQAYTILVADYRLYLPWTAR
ncbi:MAG: hypothetical protein IT317_21700 [Anaerolineales bacterium]|nr:hypothetical protein [Anaerolineales bacterium]